MSHHDEATLVAFDDGELAPGEAEAVRRHLERCSECRARLDEVRRLKAESLDLIGAIELPEPAAAGPPAMLAAEMPLFQMAAPAAAARASAMLAMSPRKSSRRWVTGLAWAATIVMAVGIGYSAATLRQPTAKLALQRESVPAAAPAPSPSADQAAPAPATPAPAEPAKAATNGRRQDARSRRPAASALARPEAAPPPERASATAQAKTADPLREERPADRKVEEDKQNKDVRAITAARAGRLTRRQLEKVKLDELVVSGATASTPKIDTVPADSAIRTLGGSIKLIDGLVADHYEQQGPLVRVVYRVTWGSLILEQRRMDTGLQFQLIAPSGAPADSIEAWRGRIK